LDEPTHHLDMESCQAMMDAVRDFEGSALVVAHDEHLLKEVATKLIVFKNDRVFFYPGTYQEFLDNVGWEEGPESAQTNNPDPEALKSVTLKNADVKSPVTPMSEPHTPSVLQSEKLPKGHERKMTRKARAELNAMKAKVLKPLEEKIKDLEGEIVASEEALKSVNRELMGDSRKGGLGALRRSELAREMKELSDKVEALYDDLDKTTKRYEAERVKFSDE